MTANPFARTHTITPWIVAALIAFAMPATGVAKSDDATGPNAFECSNKKPGHPRCPVPELHTPHGSVSGSQPITWSTTVPTRGDHMPTRLEAFAAFNGNHVTSAAHYFGLPPMETPLAPRCDPDRANCHQIPIELQVPDGYWQMHEGSLEFSIRAPYSQYSTAARYVDLAIVTPDGSRPWATGFVYGGSVLVPEPVSGTYILEITGTGDGESIEALVQVDSFPKPSRVEARLPNLVVLPPVDLQVVWNQTRGTYMGLASPSVPEVVQDGMASLGVEGCGLDEALQDGVRRCLRFSNGIGNVGTGPLMLNVDEDELALAAIGKATWTQTVFYSDGSTKTFSAGVSEYHATHTHFHFLNTTRFELYELDLESGTTGALVSSSKKGGVCLANEGWIHIAHVGTGAAPRSCGVSAMRTSFQSPNWFDSYEPETNEQYIDITGIPDGDNRLVSRVDIDGYILESDRTDNFAWADVRLSRDAVSVLGKGSAHPMAIP